MKLDMEQDLAEFLPRIGLKTDPQPAMPLVFFCPVDGSDSIGITEEEFIGMFLPWKSLSDKIGLIFQHGLKPAFGHISSLWIQSVDGITELLVVGTHRLGNGLRGLCSPKEVSYGLLPCPDLGQGPVNILIQIDAQRLVLGGKGALNFAVPRYPVGHDVLLELRPVN